MSVSTSISLKFVIKVCQRLAVGVGSSLVRHLNYWSTNDRAYVFNFNKRRCRLTLWSPHTQHCYAVTDIYTQGCLQPGGGAEKKNCQKWRSATRFNLSFKSYMSFQVPHHSPPLCIYGYTILLSYLHSPIWISESEFENPQFMLKISLTWLWASQP